MFGNQNNNDGMPFGTQQQQQPTLGQQPIQQQQQPTFGQQPQNPIHDPWAPFANAVAGGQDYPQAGVYIVKTRCLKVVASDKDGQPVYVHEFEVVQSNRIDIPPGSVLSDAYKYHPAAPTALHKNLKGFFIEVCKALGADPTAANDTSNWAKAFGGDGTALAGLQLKLVCTAIDGKKYTKRKYMQVNEGPSVQTTTATAPTGFSNDVPF